MLLTERCSLRGRTVVITGGARGLGGASASAAAAAGATVAIGGRTAAALQTARAELEERGTDVLAETLDVADAASVDAFFAAARERFGRLDVLVNNAGTAHQAAAPDVTEADWARVLETNLTGAFRCVQAFLRHRDDGPGAIVNIASIASHAAVRGQAAYVASKTGLAGLTRALALDLAPAGIRVNALAPGYFRTDMPGEVLADEQATQALLRKIPLRRIGEPEEVGPAVVFLASDASAYMTGSVLYLDGGYTAQ